MTTNVSPNLLREPAAGAVVVAAELAEGRFRKPDVRYLDVSESQSEVVFQTDAEGNWTFLNRAWTTVTGFGIEESLGTNFLDYVHPAERDATIEMFAAVISGGREFCNHETRYRTKSGRYRWVEVRARLMYDETGRIVGNAGTIVDIDARRRAEAAFVADIKKAAKFVRA
jgi:PAS domain S-box-containing protein